MSARHTQQPCLTQCAHYSCRLASERRRADRQKQGTALTKPLPPPRLRHSTDALDAAGNTTAAIGKGFAIGSAALVSLALFGAYVTRARIDMMHASILDPRVRREPHACIESELMQPFGMK